ncbi:MAG: hypothetical protein RIS36_2109 [Pseudomonadota bacterium]|jgi:hypothetical protein
MNIKKVRSFVIALVVLATLAPRIGASVDRLTWRASGTVEAISSDTLVVSRFSYKLTGSTSYEKNNHQTSRSAFAVGDLVSLTFLTDRSVLRVVGNTTDDTPPAKDQTPGVQPEVSRFTAKLSPLGTSTARGDSAGSYSDAQRSFALRIKLPRNSTPLATTDAEAKALIVTATITRRGDVVATCASAFETKRRKLSVYEFKTHLQKAAQNRLRSIKGSCVLPSGKSGLPIVRSGDLVTISEATAGEFLRGRF